MNPQLPKRIHVVGICGVATSALAIAFHKAGAAVTGSDKGFFPPVSTELEKAGVPFYAGWHPDRMIAGGKPDLVVVGTASGSRNQETEKARELGISELSFAQAIGKYFVRNNSIVCAGTWGKTSSAALLSHILSEAGMDPSYMFGGISLSHEASGRLGESAWSVFEGDEYKSSPTDIRPKFSYYKPTHLLLTAVSWDHADLYRTEEDYFEAFDKLIASLPAGGLVIANKDQAGVVRALEKRLNGPGLKIVWYGRQADYSHEETKPTGSGLEFTVGHAGRSFKVKTPMLGAFQAENIAGCFAMAREIGVAPEKIIAAVASFKGMKRRLEKRLDGGERGVTVFDDIAHSPEKAAAVLRELRGIYKGRIIAVFESNRGGRWRSAAAKYENAFRDADTVVIPRLTVQKKAGGEAEEPMEGGELASVIGKTHADARFIEDDRSLADCLVSQAKAGDVIAFLGSHGFRGMIEEVVKRLKG